MADKASQSFIILFMALMVVIGACNTIFNKFLVSSISLGANFDHFFFTTFMMFIGETFCYIAYKIYERRKKNTDLHEELTNETKSDIAAPLPPITPYILALPALCDFIGSTIMTFALVFLPGSIYQMTRGSIMLFTAAFSKIFLKSKIYIHQILALVCIFVGIGLVGLSTIVFPHKEEDPNPNPDLKPDDQGGNGMVIFGFVGLIIAQLFSAAQFVIEEKIVNKYEVHPLQMVGWEGIWGALMYIIVLVIFYFINCQPKNKMCFNYTDNGIDVAKLEDWIFSFRQIANSWYIAIFSIFYICCISAYNYVGITITKYVSSPARAVMDNARTVIIWAFFLIPVWKNTEDYKDNQEYFNFLELIGFIFLIIGTLVYNEFLIIPFAGLDRYTKKNLEKLEDTRKG
jgi:drug/metabolite transporter (DMT)-like permease